jgi:hypothetical protein
MAFLERPNRQACVIDFTGYWETDCIFDYGRQIRQSSMGPRGSSSAFTHLASPIPLRIPFLPQGTSVLQGRHRHRRGDCLRLGPLP